MKLLWAIDNKRKTGVEKNMGVSTFNITNMNLAQPLDQDAEQKGARFLTDMNIAPIQTASIQAPAPAPLPGLEV